MLSESVKRTGPGRASPSILAGVVKPRLSELIAFYRWLLAVENIAAQAVRRFRDLGRIT